MKVNTALVFVTTSPVTTVPKACWPWEVAIYEEKFGGQAAAQPKKNCSPVERKGLPDAAEEYARLQSAFGSDPTTKVPYVELTYGHGKTGVKELGKAIKKSKVTTRSPTQKKAAAKKPEMKKPEEVDPLA